VRFLKSLLDKPGHEDVALHLDVFADVQAGGGCGETKLHRLRRLSGKGAADGPLVADVEAHGCVAVGLNSKGEVVKGAGVGDVARHDASW
jgi:hypothetical protein